MRLSSVVKYIAAASIAVAATCSIANADFTDTFSVTVGTVRGGFIDTLLEDISSKIDRVYNVNNGRRFMGDPLLVS